MHPYIPHLLADIAAAHRPPADTDETIFPRSFEEEMEEIENWLMAEEAPHTFGYHCGLEASGFPPPAQLSNKDMITVCRAFDQMLFSWNMSIELPKKLPSRLKYSFRVATLNEKTAIVNSGLFCFDYCTGHAPECVFKQYCPCLKIWNSPKIDYEKWSDMQSGIIPDKMSDDDPNAGPLYDPDDPLSELPF